MAPNSEVDWATTGLASSGFADSSFLGSAASLAAGLAASSAFCAVDGYVAGVSFGFSVNFTPPNEPPEIGLNKLLAGAEATAADASAYSLLDLDRSTPPNTPEDATEKTFF